jgi:hypothetical protein
VTWDSEHACVCAEWKAFANSRELRLGGRKILDAIRRRKAAALLSDNRRIEVMKGDDQTWFSNTWTPMAVEAGLRRIAVVLAPQGLGRSASEEILSHIGNRDFVTRTTGAGQEKTNQSRPTGAGIDLRSLCDIATSVRLRHSRF